MTEHLPSNVCPVCDTPDGDHLDWCTPQAREQRPSKELPATLPASVYDGELWVKAADVQLLIGERAELRRENVRWENAHKILIAENDRLTRQVAELSIHAEKWVKRALGSAPEPALTLAFLRQLADEYVETLDQYPIESYATPREYAGSELSRFFAWLRMSSGFAVRAAQPPGDGHAG